MDGSFCFYFPFCFISILGSEFMHCEVLRCSVRKLDLPSFLRGTFKLSSEAATSRGDVISTNENFSQVSGEFEPGTSRAVHTQELLTTR